VFPDVSKECYYFGLKGLRGPRRKIKTVTQPHIPENANNQQNRCGNLKYRNVKAVATDSKP
jgi:hypothetical protein